MNALSRVAALFVVVLMIIALLFALTIQETRASTLEVEAIDAAFLAAGEAIQAGEPAEDLIATLAGLEIDAVTEACRAYAGYAVVITVLHQGLVETGSPYLANSILITLQSQPQLQYACLISE